MSSKAGFEGRRAASEVGFATVVALKHRFINNRTCLAVSLQRTVGFVSAITRTCPAGSGVWRWHSIVVLADY